MKKNNSSQAWTVLREPRPPTFTIGPFARMPPRHRNSAGQPGAVPSATGPPNRQCAVTPRRWTSPPSLRRHCPTASGGTEEGRPGKAGRWGNQDRQRAANPTGQDLPLRGDTLGAVRGGNPESTTRPFEGRCPFAYWFAPAVHPQGACRNALGLPIIGPLIATAFWFSTL
jgi:hypothetical protein